MTFNTQEFLDALPSIPRLHKAAIINADQQPEKWDPSAPNFEELANDATAYHWADGGGQSTSIYFTHDVKDQVLLLVYDHECSTNFYDEDEEGQVALYEGIPDELKKFVVDVEENYFNLNTFIEDEERAEEWGESIMSASGVAWYSAEAGWSYSPKFDELRRDDGGFGYCMRALLETESEIPEDAADPVEPGSDDLTVEDRAGIADEEFEVLRRVLSNSVYQKSVTELTEEESGRITDTAHRLTKVFPQILAADVEEWTYSNMEGKVHPLETLRYASREAAYQDAFESENKGRILPVRRRVWMEEWQRPTQG